MGCCGRPNVRDAKANYYEKYAYLNSHQKAKQLAISGSQCDTCSALTMSDAENKCTVCGNSKNKEEVEKPKGG